MAPKLRRWLLGVTRSDGAATPSFRFWRGLFRTPHHVLISPYRRRSAANQRSMVHATDAQWPACASLVTTGVLYSVYMYIFQSPCLCDSAGTRCWRCNPW